MLRPALAAAAALALGLAVTAAPAAAGNMAHVHMGHVMTGWKDTPEGKGFLPTAEAEAEVAAQHAGFAAQKPEDLDWMKTHTRHVMHAVDPTTMQGGPGHGYGLVKAANGVLQHIKLAARTDAATDNVKLHATHVATSANNVANWGQQIIGLGKEVLAAESAGKAAPLVRRIRDMTQWCLNGRDADDDGSVSWKEGEGGLTQARQHMGFMAKGEGLDM